MFVIRKAQLDAFWQLPADLPDQLLGQLASSHRAHVAMLGEPAARSLVERTVELARRHGLDIAPAILELCALVLEFGERFTHSPDQATAIQILEHPRLPPSLKLDVLRDHLRARTRGRTVVPGGTGATPQGA